MAKSSEIKNGLDWRSAWRIAGKIAVEVQFRSAMEMSQGSLTHSIEKQVEKARSNTRMNKIVYSIFTAVLAVTFGFFVSAMTTGAVVSNPDLVWTIIALLISLFSLMAFSFLLFWGIMISTSFISSGAASIGLYLPLSQSDAGKLALLGFIRLFDIQIFTIILGFPIAYFFATFSIIGTLVCFVTFLISLALSITTMLLLAIYFHSRIQSSGGSRFGSIMRMVFIFIWVFAIMGFSFSMQLIRYILPFVEGLAILLQPHWFLLSFIFPFALGTSVVQATLIPGTPFLWSSIFATLGYAVLGVLGIRWGGRFLANIGVGGIVQTSAPTIRPIGVKLHSVAGAVFRKDVRIAIRTPGQAVMLFLPVLMMVPIFLQFLGETGAIHVVDIIVLVVTPTTMISFFAIFFLGIEVRGIAYTMTLPLKTEIILQAKARLITLMAFSVPVLMFIITYFRPLTTPISYGIALSQPAVVYVSAFISLVLFIGIIGKGHLIGFEIGQHILQMIGVGIISGVFVLIPIGCYGIAWVSTTLFLSLPIEFAHLFGFLSMWGGIAFNYFIGKILARRMIKA